MNRLLVLVSLFCGPVFTLNAQNFTSKWKGSLIGFGFNFTDFQTPAEIKATSLHDVFKNKDFSSFRRLDVGFSLMYWKGLTKHVDFSARYNGLFSDYSKDGSSVNSNNYSNELEASLHARAFSDDHLFNPFISAGLGAGTYSGKVAPYAHWVSGCRLIWQASPAYFYRPTTALALIKQG